MVFRDRTDAGWYLSTKLLAYARRPDVVVLALPRSGVPIAYEVCRTLDAPLDICIVRKLARPQDPGGFGVVVSGGTKVLNPSAIRKYAIDDQTVQDITTQVLAEVRDAERTFRGAVKPIPLTGKTVILVDDGLATAATMRAAAMALKPREPARLVVAVPVGAAEACNILGTCVDEVVCAQSPEPFYSIRSWYQDLGQVTDGRIRMMLEKTLNRENEPVTVVPERTRKRSV